MKFCVIESCNSKRRLAPAPHFHGRLQQHIAVAALNSCEPASLVGPLEQMTTAMSPDEPLTAVMVRAIVVAEHRLTMLLRNLQPELVYPCRRHFGTAMTLPSVPEALCSSGPDCLLEGDWLLEQAALGSH